MAAPVSPCNRGVFSPNRSPACTETRTRVVIPASKVSRGASRDLLKGLQGKTRTCGTARRIFARPRRTGTQGAARWLSAITTHGHELAVADDSIIRTSSPSKAEACETGV
jgi:hypothetical protein